MTTHQRIIEHFLNFSYATSPQLVEIAGYRYGARLAELRQKGFNFTWGWKHDKHGKRTNTTIYIMTTPREKIDRTKLNLTSNK